MNNFLLFLGGNNKSKTFQPPKKEHIQCTKLRISQVWGRVDVRYLICASREIVFGNRTCNLQATMGSFTAPQGPPFNSQIKPKINPYHFDLEQMIQHLLVPTLNMLGWGGGRRGRGLVARSMRGCRCRSRCKRARI